MSRHARHLQELHKRIQDGEIGDIILMRGYRMHGPVGSMASIPRMMDPQWKNLSETMYQIRRFHSFIWASGGCYSDFYIHHIDHLCWMKNDWPVKAQGIGGRHYKKNPEGIEYVDQNFDSYSVEYTFKDGAKMYMDGRCINGAKPIYNSWVHGSKGIAIASKANDCGEPSSTYRGQDPRSENRIWQSETAPAERDPYLNEWVALQDAIRNNKQHNECERGVYASLVTSMGRMAAHSGQEITLDEILNHDHDYAPNADKLTPEGPAPLIADAQGRYPKPQPGQYGNREYGENAA
jgi:predicted dehydrogenase